MSGPEFLLLDAYDSYSNNIVALLHESLPCRVTVKKIDDPCLQDPKTFSTYLSFFDAVIAGPGPGSPTRKEDVGLIAQLWQQTQPKPVLGVCLGHQSLAVSFGASIRRLSRPRHGIVTDIVHSGTSLYLGAGKVRATTYNSLHVCLDDQNPAPEDVFFHPTTQCPDLEPLAWSLDDGQNGQVCMALRHVSKPFWGVQYHPESICTNSGGARVLQTWWSEARQWQWKRGSQPPTPRSLSVSPPPSITSTSDVPLRDVLWQSLPLGRLSSQHLADLLLPPHADAFVLLSGTRPDQTPVNPETGRFTIIACNELGLAERFEYRENAQTLVHMKGSTVLSQQSCPMGSVWDTLQEFIKQNRANNGPSSVPFWGGLVGYVSYEACLANIDAGPIFETHRPGICFAFVDRSLVIDHVNGQLYLQSLNSHDLQWLTDSGNRIKELQKTMELCEPFDVCGDNLAGSPGMTWGAILEGPTSEDYQGKVATCQELISAGESYELCLTGSTRVTTAAHSTDDHSHRRLFSRLQRLNPAPFSAYIRLSLGSEILTALSSSPERFLSWDRADKCQFRPIKGTVKKGPGVTRDEAERILNSDKEQAENLMIVDLIRHDLHGVANYDKVKVTKLMSVEEYETVFQLVSVIEGQPSAQSGKFGIDVLAASLPPGSMTGAPKKRSCELLQRIEGKPRGIYSGVIGYLDVGGGGDFSVVIRTAYNWSSSSQSIPTGKTDWTIGAGGAVTIQSTPSGEWEEMQTKRDALLKVFANT